mmetsp:Transcript_3135/g.6483  ORF Transcript_3135/g.6483 Transcript_3135/m.6483 type:complete len:93 (+) Transcript_3135:66-344(+)
MIIGAPEVRNRVQVAEEAAVAVARQREEARAQEQANSDAERTRMVQLDTSIKMLLEDAATAQEKALQGKNQENYAVEMMQELERERIEAKNL